MKVCPTCQIKYPDALANCPQDGTALPLVAGRTQALFDSYVGSTIDGRYQIEAKLGEGGMGVVYAARHAIIDKRFAIKVLKKEAQQEESAGKRFIQEARSASRIGHANIVDITDFGTGPDGSAYFVMEFLEGETLGQVISQGPMPAERAVRVAAQIARGLSAAHEKGIIHRDLKPENVFLVEREGQRDVVKIVDFGIAKVQSSQQKLTQVGMVLGTPEYLSPEQATGRPNDHRVDEYALGCILYEMLTGDVPFRGANAAATLSKHAFEAPIAPRKLRPDLDIPARLEAVVLKAMAKRPEDRYRGMPELLRALEQTGIDPELRSAPGRHAAAVGPNSPTKLMSTDDDLELPRRSLVPVLVAASVGAAVFVFVAGWMMLADRSLPTAPQESHVAVVGPPVRSLPPIAAPPPIPVAAAAPIAAAPSPPPVEVTLTLRSNPAGASVYCDGELVGTSPVSYTRPSGAQPVQVSFKLSGYRDMSRDLVPDGDHDLEVAMVARQHERKAPSGAGAGASSGGKKAADSHSSDLRDPFE